MFVIRALDRSEHAFGLIEPRKHALAFKRVMKHRPLRGQKGLRPYAAVKSLGPSALADGGYPLSRDFQRAPEATPFSAHNEIEDIPAEAASETVKYLALGMNVE
jgi:hypothetical protein